MKLFKNPLTRSVDWLLSGGLALLALVIFGAGLADYAYPGVSAHLLSAWSGLEEMPSAKFPLLTWFQAHFVPTGSQLLAPLAGALSVGVLYHLIARFLKVCFGDEYEEADVLALSRLGAVVATVVFALTPAVHQAFTHLDPSGFDFLWLLLSIAPLFAFARLPKGVAWLMPLLSGALAAFGTGDSVLFVWCVPLYLMAYWRTSVSREEKGYGAASLFLLAFILLALIVVPVSHGSYSLYSEGQKNLLRELYHAEGFFCVPLFAIAPAIVILFSGRGSLGGGRNWMQIAFHILMTLMTILAVATALSPSGVAKVADDLPVFASACAAAAAGYLVTYWASLVWTAHAVNDSTGAQTERRVFRPVGLTCLGLFALVLVLATGFNFFFDFNAKAGRFADQVAERIVADLGPRTWLVTDGTLDSHLRLAAQKAGKELNLICLQKDNDKAYVADLAKLAEAKGLGAYTARLTRLGILAFLEDWFAYDPAIARRVAVFGAPDLWKYAPASVRGRRRAAVPELFFFGGDEARAGAFPLEDFKRFAALLEAPANWDSHTLTEVGSHLDFVRLNLRRHLGFVACNWACREDAKARSAQNVGNAEGAAKHFDAAFAIYDFVLTEVDAGNVCALFNALDLIKTVEHTNTEADTRRAAIETALDDIKQDARRRYLFDRLPLVYGYIMNPNVLIQMGLAMMQKGNREDGLDVISRASELVAFDARRRIEMELLAPSYALERGARKELSRAYYEEFKNDLAAHPETVAAKPDMLVSLARLAFRTGDLETAAAALAQIDDCVAAGKLPLDFDYYSLKVNLHLARSEFGKARLLAQKAQALNADDVRGWSLRAVTLLRQLEAIELDDDPETRTARRAELQAELDEQVLPTLVRLDARNPGVQKILASVKIYKSGHARSVAEAGELLASAREDLVRLTGRDVTDAATSDLILTLDMMLGNTEDVRTRAEAVLHVDPQAPQANYVLGSFALNGGDLDKAAVHLTAAYRAAPANLIILNDYAELLRQQKKLDEAEAVARKMCASSAALPVARQTLGEILMDIYDTTKRAGSLGEAEACLTAANGQTGGLDPRLLLSLARVQLRLGKNQQAEATLVAARPLIDPLPAGDPVRQQFEQVQEELLGL